MPGRPACAARLTLVVHDAWSPPSAHTMTAATRMPFAHLPASSSRGSRCLPNTSRAVCPAQGSALPVPEARLRSAAVDLARPRYSGRRVRHPLRPPRRRLHEAPLAREAASEAGGRRPRRDPHGPARGRRRRRGRRRLPGAGSRPGAVRRGHARLTPAQQVIKVVRDELHETLGGTQAAFSLPSRSPRS